MDKEQEDKTLKAVSYREKIYKPGEVVDKDVFPHGQLNDGDFTPFIWVLQGVLEVQSHKLVLVFLKPTLEHPQDSHHYLVLVGVDDVYLLIVMGNEACL